MKSLAFFNGKGGVGKSLHTTMCASYLAYHEGARVALVELENPSPRIFRNRNDELALLEKEDSWLSRYRANHPEGWPAAYYDIFPWGDGVQAYSPEYLREVEDKAWDLVEGKYGEFDYVLFDFPAVFIEQSPAFKLISSNIVDLVAIPFDVDAATRKEAVIDGDILVKNGHSAVAFWNDVSLDDIKRPGFLDGGEDVFRRYGIEVLPQRIKSFVKAKRESDERLFVKSTVCWPQRYVEMACPRVIDLYRELKGRLDRI